MIPEFARPHMHVSGAICECDVDYFGNHGDGCTRCPDGSGTFGRTGQTSINSCGRYC